MKKRREELWECPNRFCGAQILFLMIGPTRNCADPTCFCGSTMQRVIRTRGRRNIANERHTNHCSTRGANDSPMLLYSFGIRDEK